eukprot:773293-Amphidinium_carterae.1
MHHQPSPKDTATTQIGLPNCKRSRSKMKIGDRLGFQKRAWLNLQPPPALYYISHPCVLRKR